MKGFETLKLVLAEKSLVELKLNKSDYCGTNKQQWFHDNKGTKTKIHEIYPENKSI